VNAAKKTKSRAGDLIFFAALLFLVAVSIGCIRSVWYVFNNYYFDRLAALIGGFLLGCFFAAFFITGYLSVFLHEIKHAIVAILAGNSPKGFKIGKEEGLFEYSFTQDTQSYNAFIFLAPYSLPLCTLLCLAGGIYPLFEYQTSLIALVGIGYGIDTLCGLRDIHPGQTDFSRLYGGFGIGIVYVLAMHVLLMISLITWSLGGLDALQNLFLGAFSYIFPGVKAFQNLNTPI
jgi:hypothetical protein